MRNFGDGWYWSSRLLRRLLVWNGELSSRIFALSSSSSFPFCFWISPPRCFEAALEVFAVKGEGGYVLLLNQVCLAADGGYWKNNLVLEDGGVGKQKRSAMGCALDFLFSLFSRYIYFPSLSNFQCLILSQTVLRFENSYHLSTWGSWRQKFHRIPPQMWWFILLFLPKSIPS